MAAEEAEKCQVEEEQPQVDAEEAQEEQGQEDAEEKPEFSFNANHTNVATEALDEPEDWKWEGKLFFAADNTFHRENGWGGLSKGATGTYTVSSDYMDIILKWDEGEQETLTTEDLGFSFLNEAGFTLTMEEGQTPPEWFRNKFTDLEDGRCIKACLYCCPASVTQHEGEPETFLQKAWDVVEDAVEKLDDAIDAVEEKAAEVLEDVVEAAQDAQEAMLRALGLDDTFKQVSDNTLDEVAPKAGPMVVDEAAEFLPAFKQLDKATPQDLTGAASEGCTNTILSFREKIRDFCDDVVEFLAEGLSGIVSCLYKVVNWIVRACKEGVKYAVELLKKVIPDCCEDACLSCMGLAAKLAAWIAKVMNALIDMVEDCIKRFLTAVGCPEWIVEKVDFNGNNKPNPDNTDDNEEPIKKRKAREAGGEQAPQQESMEEPAMDL